MKRMTRGVIALSILLFGCSTKPKPEVQDDNMTKTFDAFLSRYNDERDELYPLEATQAGNNKFNDVLQNDISEAYRKRLGEFYKKFQTELLGFDRSKLTGQEQISFDILKYETEIRLRGLSFHDNYLAIHQFWGNAITLPLLGSGKSYQPFNTVKDYDNFVGRIENFSIWADTAIVNMRKGLAFGITFPKILMERVLPQTESIIVKEPTKSIFWQPILTIPDSFPAGDKERIRQTYAKVIMDEVVPTYKKIHDFLKDEYIPKTRTSTGVYANVDGNEYYQYQITNWTTTNKTPDEIYQTGLNEVARIKAEMEKVKEKVGFKGDLAAFFTFVNDNQRFMPFKTPEEVIDGFNTINNEMQPQLKKLFNNVPRSKFEVRRTEAFREASASAEYVLGSPDFSRPGVFYVPILDAKKFNSTGMETLFLHEAIPGHHYQNSLQMENDQLPGFRKLLWYGAYGEGWALYAESLGKELGLYTDPYQYFGHLGDEMHRAIRLVVDVGIHAKGMTHDDAIKYMMDNEPISKQAATAEIERYMAIPGQALSYKIGELKIIELRKKAEKALGDKFNIARFHDEILKYGCVPLSVLDEIVDRWIEAEKKS